jgi:hypothetical protein
LKICCEHGSLSPQIRKLCRSRNAEIVHFPHDPDSHTPKAGISTPTNAQIRDLNLPIQDLPGAITDYSGSDQMGAIISTIGNSNRRDALHLDSALKSGCSAFITTDSHILKTKGELERLLGIRIFSPNEFSDLEQFLNSKS